MNNDLPVVRSRRYMDSGLNIQDAIHLGQRLYDLRVSIDSLLQIPLERLNDSVTHELNNEMQVVLNDVATVEERLKNGDPRRNY